MSQNVQSAITMLQQSNGNPEIIQQVLSTLQQHPRGLNEPRPAHSYERCPSCQCTLVKGQPKCYQCGTNVLPQKSTPATAMVPSQWADEPPMRASPQGDPSTNASQLPQFLYNQHTKHVVDPNAPFEEPSCPSSYTPNPRLQVWHPAMGVYMHPAEK